MSDVTVPFGDSASDTATLLLAAADKLDLDPSAVRTVEGAFVVPREVADEADVDYESDEEAAEEAAEEEPKPAAKKAAKKSSRR
jgi:hypothetical protein